MPLTDTSIRNSKPRAEPFKLADGKVLRRIEARGALETAHRAQHNCNHIFRYAIATGRAERNPVPDFTGCTSSR